MSDPPHHSDPMIPSIERPRGDPPAASIRLANWRRLWVFVFMICGLPAMFSAMVLPFDPPLALPWFVLTWTIAGVSGYRIWQIDHPLASPILQIGRGLKWAVTSAVGVIVLVSIGAAPLLLIIPLVAWLVVMAVMMVAMVLANRGHTNP